MITLGVGPVFTATGAITHGGTFPARKHVRVSVPDWFGLTSTMKATLVFAYATTPRCVVGSTLNETGAESPVAVGCPKIACRSTGTFAMNVKLRDAWLIEYKASVLSPLLTTIARSSPLAKKPLS